MNEPDLFPEGVKPENERAARTHGGTGDSAAETGTRVARSALWAAYGDALGWISELTDARGLKRRTGGAPLNEHVAWKRRIGGRSGVTASLPQGCCSDDSQLRLATGRAIRSDGFDVEAFAKVELPVWLSYGLGGGKSTCAAAAQLGRKNPTWWSNRFRGVDAFRRERCGDACAAACMYGPHERRRMRKAICRTCCATRFARIPARRG